jgi:hypothetical protein
VQCHGDFGAILRLGRRGKASILRILPLTDTEIEEALASLDLPASCGLGETLGRISQLVDALPWLCGLEAQARLLDGESGGPAPLDPSVRVAFRPVEYRPR